MLKLGHTGDVQKLVVQGSRRRILKFSYFFDAYCMLMMEVASDQAQFKENLNMLV